MTGPTRPPARFGLAGTATGWAVLRAASPMVAAPAIHSGTPLVSRGGELGAVLRRPDLRWTVMVVVLAVAGVVALWPSDIQRPPETRRADPAGSTTSAPQVLVDGPRTAPTPDDTALADLRQRAALEPCPAPRPGAPAATAPPATGPLAGIIVPCLGAPGAVDLAAALAGRPALLNVWASWCRPCREEIPVLADYADRPGALPVIGINVQDQPADALDVLIALGVPYPSVTDPDATLLAALGSPPVLPLTYVLRSDGSIAWVSPPVVFRTPDEVADAVARHGGPPA